jgi:cell division protein FtsL
MGGSAGIGVDYVITMDSCTIVFVQLLTCLQGTSTMLAKHESIRQLLISNTNKSQVAPVLKSQFENLELELSTQHFQSR